MSAPPGPYVGRLAPSPTGALHVGNARSFLIAWLAARHAQGKLILRIEDIDSPRIKPNADGQAIEDLRWLGLDWDEGPIYQIPRLPSYLAALRQLQDQERVYPCTCSRKDIEQAASAPHLEHEGPAYPGTCRQRTVADAATLGVPFAWRLRAEGLQASFVDSLKGLTTVPAGLDGDFVVWKNSGTPAYQLAVVVDDAAMSVTDVVRGDDLIPSTPRQLLLYRLLGLRPPRFAHVPLVVGPDGRRLAKRHGDTRLAALRQQGVSPTALVGFLAWTCGWLPSPRPVTPADLLPMFDLRAIPAPPFVLTPDHVSALASIA